MVPLGADGFLVAVQQLATTDKSLARVVADHGVPAFWSRPASFATLVLFILEQQVSLASGRAVFDRLRGLVGPVTPQTVGKLSPDDLRGVGMTRQKASYVADLAVGIVSGGIDWPTIVAGDPPAARRTLLAIRGIGPWTADVWLLACRQAPDIWPIGDRALQVGCAEVIGHPEPLVGGELIELGARWAPHRSTAARLVWHSYLARRNRAETIVEGLV